MLLLSYVSLPEIAVGTHGFIAKKQIRLCITQGRICLLVIRFSKIVRIFLELAARCCSCSCDEPSFSVYSEHLCACDGERRSEKR